MSMPYPVIPNKELRPQRIHQTLAAPGHNKTTEHPLLTEIIATQSRH